MHGLLRQFGFNLALAASVAGLSALGAVVAAARNRRLGRPAIPAAARILAAGSAVLVVVVTALPNEWPIRWDPGHQLVLQPGMGSLHFWTEDLPRFPNTLPSILLVANVVAYVPLAFFALIGWEGRFRALIALGCLSLSILVELAQYTAIGGVSETDDVILNMLGAALGFLLGTLALRIKSVRR